MMRYALFVVILLAAMPALADTLRVDRAACRLVAHHRPLPDVEYQPGVDVHGREVAPADLSPPLQIGDSFTIPVTLDIGEQFGIPMPGVEGTRATVAMITVNGDDVYLDGQPLTPEQEDNLAVLCLEEGD